MRNSPALILNPSPESRGPDLAPSAATVYTRV